MNVRLGVLAALLLFPILLLAQQTSDLTSQWTKAVLSFRPVAITSDSKAFWVCGAGEGIATSTDGQNWVVKHHRETGGALLLGIDFPSSSFGYAWGTGGTLLITQDGGTTWSSRTFGDENILLASLSDPTHGVLRTTSRLALLTGTDSLTPVPVSDAAARFKYTPALASLSARNSAVLLSEGAFGEAGILYTTDAGQHWNFYDPPSTGVSSFLRVDERYWLVGHEVVDKNKPGGGHSVPLASSSSDGASWQRTSADIQPCHWQGCGLCKASGCLASNTLLLDPFVTPATNARIPRGHLSTHWASQSGQVCSVDGDLFCTPLLPVADALAQGDPKPSEPLFPPLGTPRNSSSLLRCIACSLDPVFVDKSAQGQHAVHVKLVVRSDGTVQSAAVEDAPSPTLQTVLVAQMMLWLFEPPTQAGKPVTVNTQTVIHINVVRSR